MARECARVGLAAPRVEVRNGMVVTTFVRGGEGERVWEGAGGCGVAEGVYDV